MRRLQKCLFFHRNVDLFSMESATPASKGGNIHVFCAELFLLDMLSTRFYRKIQKKQNNRIILRKLSILSLFEKSFDSLGVFRFKKCRKFRKPPLETTQCREHVFGVVL